MRGVVRRSVENVAIALPKVAVSIDGLTGTTTYRGAAVEVARVMQINGKIPPAHFGWLWRRAAVVTRRLPALGRRSITGASSERFARGTRSIAGRPLGPIDVNLVHVRLRSHWRRNLTPVCGGRKRAAPSARHLTDLGTYRFPSSATA